MIDEGIYWETKDEKLLQEVFNRYNLLMDNFALALETIPMEKDEKYENYFGRLLERIPKKGAG